MEAERPKAQKPFIGEFRPIRDPFSKTGTPEHPPLLGAHFIQLAGASGNLKIQRLLRALKQGVPLPASNQLVFLSENLPVPWEPERFEHFHAREDTFPYKWLRNRWKGNLTSSAGSKRGSIPIFSSILLRVKINLFV